MDKSMTPSAPKKAGARPNKRRRWLLPLIIIGALFLLTIGLFAYHYLAWDAYVKRAETVYGEARAQSAALLKDEDMSVEKITTLSHNLTSTAEKMCAGEPLLTELRRKISASAREQQANCEKARGVLTGASKVARAMSDRLATEQRINAIYAGMPKSLGEAGDDFAAQQKLWQEVKVALEKAEIDGLYEEHRKAQVAAVQAIDENYAALLKADEGENRAEFDDAYAKLDESYGALHDVVNGTGMDFSSLAEQFVAAIEKL